MSNGNGYDSRGEDQAIHVRLGAVEHREILLAGSVTRFSVALADLRDELVAIRGEVRQASDSVTRCEKLLEAIAANLGAL